MTNAYDGFGRPASATLAMDGVSRTLSSQDDAGGRRTGLSHPDTHPFTYAYDAAGRPTWIYQGFGTAIPLVRFDYDARGLLVNRPQGGGASVAYSHDPLGRPASQTDLFVGGTGNVTTAYAYSPAGQIASRSRDRPPVSQSN